MGLMHRPDVLFLDEPTTGLDPEARADMWAEIARMAEDGMTVLLTTHYLEEADQLADHLVIVDRGKQVAEGTPDQLKSGLRGDAVVVELAVDADLTRATKAVSGVAGISEITVEGPSGRGPGGPRRRRGPGGAQRPRRDRCTGRGQHRRPAVAGRRLPAAHRPHVHRGGQGRRQGWRQGRRQGRRPDRRQRRGQGRRPMSTATFVPHTGYLTVRLLRSTVRQPAYVVITLVQPMIWLLLFGQLFKRVVEIPGFTGGSYIDFLTPGVVAMTVLFSSGWTGMAFIEDKIGRTW